MNTDKKTISTYHDAAVDILELYDKSPAKSDEILSSQFILFSKKRPFRRVCQFIFLTLLRNKLLIDSILKSLCKKKPSPKTLATLRGAAAEIVASPDDKLPKIIDSWVEFAKRKYSKPEAGFVNAVLRRFCEKLSALRASTDVSAENLSILYSTPLWLVERWIGEFGAEQTVEMLKINSEPSEVFLRKSPSSQADAMFSKFEQFLNSTNYPNFFALKSGHWDDISELLDSSCFYIQDPSTFNAPKMFAPEPALDYLDLCAAPGGKSRTIADLILAKFSDKTANYPADALKNTRLVSVDFGEKRMKNLRENLGRIDFLKSYAIDCDILSGDLSRKLESANLPTLFDGVFLDAPCSNTGVLRRRPDARYRITPDDISNCAAIQQKLLECAAKFVKPNGKLAFSTCSVEKSENAENVAAFLKAHKDFTLEAEKTIFPSKNSDGASAFILRKKEGYSTGA